MQTAHAVIDERSTTYFGPGAAERAWQRIRRAGHGEVRLLIDDSNITIAELLQGDDAEYSWLLPEYLPTATLPPLHRR